MAQGFLQSFDDRLEVFSAGTVPAGRVNPKAVEVMAEEGVNISNNIPRSVDEYLNDRWDYVITVCDEANEACPFFPGIVQNRIHMGFKDPSNATGSDEFIMSEFRRVRDLIRAEFSNLYQARLIKELNS
jgi:arsenate reductase